LKAFRQPRSQPSAPCSPDPGAVLSADPATNPPDPARIAVGCLLTRALAAAGPTYEEAGRDGSVCLILLPDPARSEVARDEWQARARSGERFATGDRPDYRETGNWVVWAPEERLRSYAERQADETFAASFWKGLLCAGLAADPSRLPADLVAAADHRLIPTALTSDDVAQIAWVTTPGAIGWTRDAVGRPIRGDRLYRRRITRGPVGRRDPRDRACGRVPGRCNPATSMSYHCDGRARAAASHCSEPPAVSLAAFGLDRICDLTWRGMPDANTVLDLLASHPGLAERVRVLSDASADACRLNGS